MDELPARSPTILITRLSHIGDCVLTLPTLARIKQQVPESRIVWAVESPTHQLLELVPGIDHIVKVPRGWLSKPSMWKQLRRELKSYSIDIAIDPQGITKSAALGWISGAKRRVGIRGRWGRELSPYCNNVLVPTQEAHVVDRSLELLEAALGCSGADDGSVDLKLPVCKSAQAEIDQWIASLDIGTQSTTGDFVLINPGASWASKRWEMDRLGHVAAALHAQYDLPSIVVWAGDAERSMAESVVARSKAAAVLARSTTLRELAALTKRAKFFLGGDTGPMHIAVAVGTPCVGLYGSTRPEESGAYGQQHIAVQKWYQAGSCRQRRQAPNDAMRAIEVEDVVAACHEMIAKVDAVATQQAA